MTKRSQFVFFIMLALLLPTLALAGSNFSASKAVINSDNTIVVPLEITNEDQLAALDIPLTYSEGFTLKEVSFTDTRVEDFAFKRANIDVDKRLVVIGLIAQIGPDVKARLKRGSGTIANLIFEVNDPTASELILEATTLENPHHSLKFVYFDKERKINSVLPDFKSTTIVLANVAVEGMPTNFAISQNYPNPFNPTTQISFDLPKATIVEIVVYNVLGQKLVTLADGMMEAGTHAVTFEGSTYSSGVYFYRMTTAEFTKTNKMVLMK